MDSLKNPIKDFVEEQLRLIRLEKNGNKQQNVEYSKCKSLAELEIKQVLICGLRVVFYNADVSGTRHVFTLARNDAMGAVFKQGNQVTVNVEEKLADESESQKPLLDRASSSGAMGNISCLSDKQIQVSFPEIPEMLKLFAGGNTDGSHLFVVCKSQTLASYYRKLSILSALECGVGPEGGVGSYCEPLVRLLLTDDCLHLLNDLDCPRLGFTPLNPDLNEAQIKSVVNCLHQNYLSIIQGPPGKQCFPGSRN